MIYIFEYFLYIFSTTDIVPTVCILLTIFNLVKYSWLPFFLFIHNRRLDILKENLFIELDYLLVLLTLKKSISFYIIKNLYYKEIYSFYINIIFFLENNFYDLFYESFYQLFTQVFNDLIINNIIILFLNNIVESINVFILENTNDLFMQIKLL